jgi:hypothetical protein
MSLSGPRDLVHFELRDHTGKAIWSIRADPPQTPEDIYYGLVPAGFIQGEPAGGAPPRPLVFGEPLTAETRTLRRIFVHQGWASGEAGILIEDYTMQLLPATHPEQ